MKTEWAVTQYTIFITVDLAVDQTCEEFATAFTNDFITHKYRINNKYPKNPDYNQAAFWTKTLSWGTLQI